MGLGVVRILIFAQLVIALAFFSGNVTVDQLTDGVRSAQRAITTLCTRVIASPFSPARW